MIVREKISSSKDTKSITNIKSKMADLDRNNNNFKIDDNERMKKKRFSSVLNFFNDIIGKTSSLSSGLDNSNNTTSRNSRYFSVSKRKSKRQASAPDLTSNIDAFETNNKSENNHKRIAPTISVPASLNLPRAHVRKPILSTNSLNKADINEEWLRPTRYRNYRSNGNINYYESDLSLDSFANSNSRLNLVAGGGNGEQSGTLERQRAGLKGNQKVRFSFDNLQINKTDEQKDSAIKRCHSSNSSDLHSLRQSQHQNDDSSHHRRDLEDALNVLRKLDQSLETQSEKSLLHVGEFVCSVERSHSSSDLLAAKKSNDNNNSNNQNDTDTVSPDPVITVQVDRDEIFGGKEKKRISRQPCLSSLKDNRTGSLSRSNKSLSSRSHGARDLENCFVEVDEKEIIPENEKLQLNEQLEENSFWGNSITDSQTLTDNEIRKIAENEARQILLTTDFQERNIKKWTKSLTCNVRDRIRAYTGRQFKVAVNAFIGTLVPSLHDTVNVTVRGLTDPSKDRFVVAAFEIDDVFISVTCILIRTDS